MPLIEPSECLTALLTGLHYARPRFTIANFFNEILDSVGQLPGFQTPSIGPHALGFRVGSINATLTHETFVINSHLNIGKDLLAHLPKRDEKYISLPPAVYDDKFDVRKGIEVFKESPKTFRRNFVDECIEIIRLVDKIAEGGLSPFRFVGLVEYYAVPLDSASWDVLERFTKEAEIPGGMNTEKMAINRYYFPASQDEDERCFIFGLVKPDDHREKEPVVAGASFDFQLIPEKPKAIAEFGGPKEMVTSLAIGIRKMIDRSRFMNFTPRK